MDKQKLSRHKTLVRDIQMYEKQLDRLYDRNMDIPIVMGKVKGSMQEFPYTEVRTTVQMQEPEQAEEINKLIRIKKGLLARDRKDLLEIEQYIAGIENIEIRQIFELSFYEGKKQWEVAKIMGFEQSSISKKITEYLRHSYNS